MCEFKSEVLCEANVKKQILSVNETDPAIQERLGTLKA